MIEKVTHASIEGAEPALVSVVVPAYNAETTITETLLSILQQTYRSLEIIVVDDGSGDRTREIALQHAAQDDRIRLITQTNGGVARARNAGIAASRGTFIAPIDADDLWHPDKIARQVSVMQSAPEPLGFVYTLYRRIDESSRILYSQTRRPVEGRTFPHLLLENFVGNGSALLIRREALESMRGYDPALRDAGVEGCEDYLLQLMIARSWPIGCVAEYLTGYRRVERGMSSDQLRMLRSHLAMCELVEQRCPDVAPDQLRRARARFRALAALRLAIRGGLSECAGEMSEALRCHPAVALRSASTGAYDRLQSFARRRLKPLTGGIPEDRPQFAAADPRVFGVIPTSRNAGWDATGFAKATVRSREHSG